MEKYNEKIIIGEKKFWPKWFSKLFYSLISVKVWGLVAGTWVSTYLLLNETDAGFSISGAQWLTFNTTIWALIFGMKEIFRISEKRDLAEKENLKEHLDSKIEISSMLKESSSKNSKETIFTPDGLEIVGDEPEIQP